MTGGVVVVAGGAVAAVTSGAVAGGVVVAVTSGAVAGGVVVAAGGDVVAGATDVDGAVPPAGTGAVVVVAAVVVAVVDAVVVGVVEGDGASVVDADVVVVAGADVVVVVESGGGTAAAAPSGGGSTGAIGTSGGGGSDAASSSNDAKRSMSGPNGCSTADPTVSNPSSAGAGSAVTPAAPATVIAPAAARLGPLVVIVVSGPRNRSGRCASHPTEPVVHWSLPSEIWRKARTRPGSNWVPALLRSSARACAVGCATLYERGAVMTS